MRSLASASRLLASCTTIGQAAALVREIGFSSSPVPLEPDGIKLLGLAQTLSDCHIVAGDDTLRALIFEIPPECDERSCLKRVAAILSSRAPELLFLLVAIHHGRRTLSVAAFDSMRPRPHVSALIVRTDSVVDSDSETIWALASGRSNSALLTHCRWLEILGRESIGRRFFRDLERVVSGLASSLSVPVAHRDSSQLALLCVSRLLFLSFLETKGWMNADHAFLANGFASCMITGGAYHRKVLSPLFFGTLNTRPQNRAPRARRFGRIPFLNGGLFNKSSLEVRNSRSHFTDEALGDVFGELLARYRFTAREDGTAWTEAAVDPEMLGKAFECLMNAHDRRSTGAFYTPQPLVREVTRDALSHAIASGSCDRRVVIEALRGSIPPAPMRSALLAQVVSARVLDPACGSGAFLVHVLEELSALRTRLGDLRPAHAIRREVLTHSIFGVDINPMAVWLCELRLWLSMAIEDPEHDPLKVTPLPNLDRNIRVGDSLSGDGFGGARFVTGGGRLSVLRSRYSRATGPRKQSLARMLDALERKCAVSLLEQRVTKLTHERRELLLMLRSRDLFGLRSPATTYTRACLAGIRRDISAARREIGRLGDGGALPFSFLTGFADTAARGGFTIVVGNPPWVRTHHLERSSRAALRERFDAYRKAAWMGGSEAAGAGRGFASQVDAAALFTERCVDLLASDGAMSLILPAKLWRSLAGGGVRQVLQNKVALCELHDLTRAPATFDAAVYPSIITASRSHAGSLALATHLGGEIVRWTSSQQEIPFDESAGSPWIIAPPDVRSSFEKVRAAGVPLARTAIGRPLLGVKTGCNEAFLVSNDAGIEPHLLRPAVRGDHVHQWSIARSEERIIWTHDRNGPLPQLPPGAHRRLRQWRPQLERRSDAQRSLRWWSLFRTEAADFTSPRVVWADIGKWPRAAVLDACDKSVPLNTCYVVRCADPADAHALAAVLNSKLAASWLGLVAEPARGGYMRYMGWTVSLLPLPCDWARARQILAPIRAGISSGAWSDQDVMAAVLDAYRLRADDIAPLLAWSN